MAVLQAAEAWCIENYPEGKVEELDAVNNPEDPAAGTRKVPFSRELYIEHDDFREVPPPEVLPARARARGAPALRLLRHVRRAWSRTTAGEVVELRCTYDPATRGGDAPDGRKVKGTIHWVSADARRRRRGAALRPPLRAGEPRRGARGKDWLSTLQPDLARVVRGASVEPALAAGRAGRRRPVRARRLLLRRPARLTPRAARSSTAPSPCATPGRRSRRRARGLAGSRGGYRRAQGAAGVAVASLAPRRADDGGALVLSSQGRLPAALSPFPGADKLADAAGGSSPGLPRRPRRAERRGAAADDGLRRSFSSRRRSGAPATRGTSGSYRAAPSRRPISRPTCGPRGPARGASPAEARPPLRPALNENAARAGAFRQVGWGAGTRTPIGRSKS